MKCKYFFLALLTATDFSMASGRALKPTEPQQAKVEVSKRNTLWVPIPIAVDVEQFQPGYKGVDPAKFFALFESKVSGLKKGEFETSTEFEGRIKDKDALLAPINTNDAYAFLIQEMDAKYDADVQLYSLKWNGYPPCSETYGYPGSKAWVTCRIALMNTRRDKYTGVNAFGTKVEVRRVIKEDFALAFSDQDPALTYFSKRVSGSGYDYFDTIFIPIEKARTLSGSHIGILIVGNVVDTKIIESGGFRMTPTINDPAEILSFNKAIPFKISKIIYYVIETGEILNRR